MKTIVRTLGLGAVVAAFMAVGGVTAFAQDPCADLDAINALDTKIRADYPKMETKPQAIEEGKQYLEKYGNCPVSADFATWLKGRIPVWEADLNKQKTAGRQKELHDKFDAGFNSKNYDDSFAAAGQYLTEFPNDPSNISLIVTLGLVGPRETVSKNAKYNANSEKYAKMALEQLKTGNPVAQKNGHYGFQIECESKAECISALTFGIGYMNYYGNNNKQAALPYYYEVTKIPGTNKSNPYVYGTIGDYYYDTVLKLKDEAAAMIKATPAPDATDEVKTKYEADVKAKIAMLNGYLERDMDAYSRAYSLAKADPQASQYSDTIYKRLQALYSARFQKQDGINEWITAAVAKPFPDPTSAVAPIADAETTTGGGSTGSTPPVKPAATPAATPSKPSSTTGPAKPGNKVGGTGSTGISENTSAENAKAPSAKSAAVKRTGNR